MNNNDQQNHIYKIVLVGDAAVGKTHILNRFVRNEPPKSTVPTIGVEFATKTTTLKDGGQVKVQVWDTAGQEKYRSITSAHYRKAVGALLVYDITKEKSFQSVEKWLDEIKQNAEEDIILMLVGNKLDIVEENPQMRRVNKETAQQFAQEHNIMFQESSALHSQRVQGVFEQLLEEIYDYKSRILSTINQTNQQMYTNQNQQIEDNDNYLENLKYQTNVKNKNNKNNNNIQLKNQGNENNYQNKINKQKDQGCCENN